MNFLEAYRQFTAWPANEAPPEYHTWAAFSVLSSCCGPNLWTDMGILGNIQPNIYVMFVGPPGIKKSTAKDIAKDILRCVHTTQYPIPLAPANCTHQALVDYMAAEKSPCRLVYDWHNSVRKYTKMCFYTDEFVNLVQTGGDPLLWVQFLTELYNPQVVFDTSTVGRGEKKLPYPYITFLGCMTPELTKSLINEGALSGGFSRRTIYIYANKNDRPVPRPVISDAQREAKKFLVERCQRIQRLNGKFEFSPSGGEFYDEWYKRNFAEIQESPTAAVTNFLQSKPTLAIKLAMLAHLSHSDELVIEKDDLELAVTLLTESQQHINTIFAGVGKNPHAATMAGIQQFVNQICSRPPHFVILKKIHGNFLAQASTKDIDDLLQQMQRVDQIKLVEVQLPGTNQWVSAVTSLEFYDRVKRKDKKPFPQ